MRGSHPGCTQCTVKKARPSKVFHIFVFFSTFNRCLVSREKKDVRVSLVVWILQPFLSNQSDTVYKNKKSIDRIPLSLLLSI